MSVIIWYVSIEQMWWYTVLWDGKEEMGSRRSMHECWDAVNSFISVQSHELV